MDNVHVTWAIVHETYKTPEINTESFKMIIFQFLVPDIPNKFSTLVVTFTRYKTELKNFPLINIKEFHSIINIKGP